MQAELELRKLFFLNSFGTTLPCHSKKSQNNNLSSLNCTFFGIQTIIMMAGRTGSIYCIAVYQLSLVTCKAIDHLCSLIKIHDIVVLFDIFIL